MASGLAIEAPGRVTGDPSIMRRCRATHPATLSEFGNCVPNATSRGASHPSGGETSDQDAKTLGCTACTRGASAAQSSGGAAHRNARSGLMALSAARNDVRASLGRKAHRELARLIRINPQRCLAAHAAGEACHVFD
jgi:hypothetical protein